MSIEETLLQVMDKYLLGIFGDKQEKPKLHTGRYLQQLFPPGHACTT
jgi:hypothetical protein